MCEPNDDLGAQFASIISNTHSKTTSPTFDKPQCTIHSGDFCDDAVLSSDREGEKH